MQREYLFLKDQNHRTHGVEIDRSILIDLQPQPHIQVEKSVIIIMAIEVQAITEVVIGQEREEKEVPEKREKVDTTMREVAQQQEEELGQDHTPQQQENIMMKRETKPPET